MKKPLGPTDRIYPMPCPLVVGGSMQESDMLAVAWMTIVSPSPPRIGMSLRRTRRTLELIREHGDFTVNFAPTEMAAQVDYCGITSGRAADKWAASGLTAGRSSQVSAPLIAECPLSLECRVDSEVDLEDYVFVIGEILETHAEESLLDPDGKLDITALDPLVYVAGVREYRGLGPKLADAFAIGKNLTAG
ncbi:MAG: hypothetical protein CVT60_02240 [Actinobacteria bacterium HGW-Actinobacteria-10]|jgi:flavin reductase (DIM6/NTAB) family NADH-FMN oxidoreductase RutF|nr:MAG: hypothetical protein CVT60_02240 [Actinobacteria bacterium HGW-Actinobacteria-10]